MTGDAVQRMMDRNSFIDSIEAKKMGLCDEIEQTVSLNTKNFPKEVKAFQQEAGKVLNKIINKTTMKKVFNKLGLTEAADEDSVLESINVAVNKAVDNATTALNKKSKEDMDKMKADMDEAEDKFKKQKEAFDKATAELAEANNKIKEAADKALDIEAKTFAENVTKEGKVKNEAKAIEKVVAQYKANPAGTKEIFEAIPMNKTGVKFEFRNETKQEDSWSAAGELAKISNKLSK
jgi:cellobiose-specific phosphotransferase system component IIA